MRKKLAPRRVARKIKEESKDLRQEVRRRTLTYITDALGLVVGLPRNEAIKSVIEYLFPLSQNTMAAKLIYATVMTMILVFATAYIFKEQKEENKNLL